MLPGYTKLREAFEPRSCSAIGKKPYYSIEQVKQAVQRGKFSEESVAYAHAAFCNQADFDRHYQPLGASFNYVELRRVIGVRYLYGQLEFNALAIIKRFRR